jgi:acid-sensing ion channel, other
MCPLTFGSNLTLLDFRTQVMQQVCYTMSDYVMQDLRFTFDNSSAFVNFLKENVSHPQRNWFNGGKAFWNGQKDPEFTETIVRNGIGFTFNMIDAKDWLDFESISRDFDYKSTAKGSMKASSMVGSGLQITLQDNYDIRESHLICQENKFSVHSPNQFALESLIFSYEHSLDVLIIPKITETDEDLRSTSPNSRKCFFEDERKLKYFKVYSKPACDIECKSHLVYEYCDCIPFFLPRNDSMTVCDVYNLMCYHNFMTSEFSDKEDFSETNGFCGCLDDCNSIKYDIQLNHIKHYKNHSTR